MDYKTEPTSAEVWAVIKARHGKDLKVFGSYSAPDGDFLGDPSICKMFTSYGFSNGDYPIMEAETTWRTNPEKRHERINETTKYWLCLPVKETD